MAQRFVVIRCLRAQCESGQLLVDLFVNYDCDLEGQNLFERMVLALVRLAQGNVPQDATAQLIAEEQAMRLAVSVAASSCAYMMQSIVMADFCLELQNLLSKHQYRRLPAQHLSAVPTLPLDWQCICM
jgi:hypothetical protein